MKNKTLILLIAFLAMLLITKPVQASTEVAGSSAMLKNSLQASDPRLEKLQEFLKSYDSSLVGYTENFIKAADEYQIDWKLVPAITGVESSFGKKIPFNSYNAYGWSNGAYRFQSWEQSINHVSRFLKEKYIDRGLDNPYKIGPVYAPPSPNWAGKVAYFMNQIECFGQKNCPENFTLTL